VIILLPPISVFGISTTLCRQSLMQQCIEPGTASSEERCIRRATGVIRSSRTQP